MWLMFDFTIYYNNKFFKNNILKKLYRKEMHCKNKWLKIKSTDIYNVIFIGAYIYHI